MAHQRRLKDSPTQDTRHQPNRRLTKVTSVHKKVIMISKHTQCKVDNNVMDSEKLGDITHGIREISGGDSLAGY